MDEPELPRVNQLGITYHQGEKRDFHYELILERILRIPENHIVGIDERGDNRFLFEVANKEIYEAICEQFTGRDISIGHGGVIQVDDISSYGTRIELSKVPFQVSNDMIKNVLQKYGEVYKVQNYYKTFGKYRNFKRSGFRIARVKLRNHIPQSLLIKQTQTTINVQYQTQPASCYKCGNPGHRSWRCNTQRDNHKNEVDLNLNESTITNKEVNTSENDNVYYDADINPNVDINACNNENSIAAALDVHIDSSQSTNRFECNECSFKCSYIEILNEHKQIHTGEKPPKCCKCDIELCNKVRLEHTGEGPFKCDKCRYKSKEELAQEDLSLLEKYEESLKCTECQYKCKNIDILIGHLKSHNIYLCSKCDFKGNTSQSLSSHIKVHNKKTFKCPVCDYKCTTLTKLNAHKRNHTEENIVVEPDLEVVNNIDTENTPLSNNRGKRDLSVSPEGIGTDRKTSENKKSKA